MKHKLNVENLFLSEPIAYNHINSELYSPKYSSNKIHTVPQASCFISIKSLEHLESTNRVF